MRNHFILSLLAGLVLFSCKKETTLYNPPPPIIDTMPVVLLKEIVIPNLPSPYYHFEYTADKKIKLASFASGFNIYDVFYSNNRLSEMKNTIIVNKDRLQYTYDSEGKTAVIQFRDSTGLIYNRIFFTYAGGLLIKAEWEKKTTPGFLLYKTMSMTYHADGNLKDLTLHRPPVDAQPEITYTDHFEQYDNGTNADGFSLLHTEFFEHFVLLPGIHLQRNNPVKQTRTGDGANFKIDYTYTYNDKKLPVMKTGALLFLSGTDAGKTFQTRSSFSYYE